MLQRKNTRRVIALIFLLSVLIPLVFTLYVNIREYELHRRMEKIMESGNVQLVAVPENEMIWMDRNEIWLNGRMFDIHSIEKKDHLYLITGLYDEEETELAEKEKRSPGKTSEENRKLISFYKDIAAFHNAMSGIHDPRALIVLTHYTRDFQAILSRCEDIPTPPPQFRSPFI